MKDKMFIKEAIKGEKLAEITLEISLYECETLQRELQFLKGFPYKIYCKDCEKYCNDCEITLKTLNNKNKEENKMKKKEDKASQLYVEINERNTGRWVNIRDDRVNKLLEMGYVINSFTAPKQVNGFAGGDIEHALYMEMPTEVHKSIKCGYESFARMLYLADNEISIPDMTPYSKIECYGSGWKAKWRMFLLKRNVKKVSNLCRKMLPDLKKISKEVRFEILHSMAP